MPVSRSISLALSRVCLNNALVIQPIPIALLLAIALAVGWRASGRRGYLVLVLLWIAYAVYETLMYTRVLCSGECNIRVDLLLLYPLLAGRTLWISVAAVMRAILRRRDTSGGPAA